MQPSVVPVQVQDFIWGDAPYEMTGEPMKVPASLPVFSQSVREAASSSVTIPSVHSLVGTFPGRATATPTVDFEDMTGWKALFYDGSSGELWQTHEQLLQGDWVAQLRYQGPYQGTGRIDIVPPAAITVPAGAQRVGLWVFATEWWGWEPQTIPPSTLGLVFQDGDGQFRSLTLQTLDWKEWFWVERQIPQDWPRPLLLTAIELSDVRAAQRRSLYLDALSFYSEPAKRALPQPAPGSPAWMPSDPGATVPAAAADPVISQAGSEVVIATRSAEGITYRYTPKTGTLSDIQVEMADGRHFQPFVGGGITGQVGNRLITPQTPGVERRLLQMNVEDNSVTTRWQWSWRGDTFEFTLRLRPVHKSLVAEFYAPKGGRSLLFGRVSGINGARMVEVPYWSYIYGPSSGNPKLLAANGLFLTSYLDWNVSNASRIYAPRGTAVSKDGAAINGGAQYLPLLDGSYNPLFERVVLNISSHLDEVLPVIPHPSSTRQELLRKNLQATYMGLPSTPAAWTQAFDHLRALWDLGVSHLFVRHHEESWRDGGESYTLRDTAAPAKGGDSAVVAYVARVRNELGFDVGLYTNYVDIAPVNGNFALDWVARTEGGELMRSWPRTYRLNSTAALAFESVYAPLIAKKFGTNGSYTDVHTALPPWEAVDYDPRAPGAGVFRTVYQDYGSLLLHDQQVYDGEVMSEGGVHWLYAGLVDSNYGQVRLESGDPNVPLLVDFQLRRIHELEGDADVVVYGQTGQVGYYTHLAQVIAFGNRGALWLPADPVDSAKTYFLMQQLQQRYVMEKVAAIRYGAAEDKATGSEDLLSSEDAVTSGAYLLSRVYIEYQNGLQLWVNGGPADWTIKAAGREWTLPSGGWLAQQGDFIEFSARVGGRRLDVVISPEYIYVDPHERPLEPAEFRSLGLPQGPLVGTDVPVVLLSPNGSHRRGDGWQVIPLVAPGQQGHLELVPSMLSSTGKPELSASDRIPGSNALLLQVDGGKPYPLTLKP
ncbi:MAG: hypothetical protein IMX01_07405 [Limnochordaceae bacterium]|nr:hypothetical protein [Limnochordaceae bacterium]